MRGSRIYAALFFYIHLHAVKIKIIYFLPAFIWFIIANFLFLMPGEDVPTWPFLDEIYFDKWVHCGLFFGLTFLTAFPFIKALRLSKKLLIKISITFALYGVLIEFLQLYIAIDRDYDVLDMIADAIGCGIGFIAANWLWKRALQKNKPL